MTQFNQEDITKTVNSFEAAVSARHVTIPEIAPGKLLLAIDGSNQDKPAIFVAAAVAKRTESSHIHVTYAYEGPADAQRDAYLSQAARQLSEHASSLTVTQSREAHPDRARSFQQIMHLARERQCGLIITMAPYLDDFEKLGRLSTGTNLDMILRGRSTPLLVVREAFEQIERCLDHVIVPLSLLGEHDTEALAWGLKLVEPESGTVHLLAIADNDAIKAAGSLLGSSIASEEIDQHQLAGLVQPRTAGIVAAAQRTAAERSLNCRVSVRVGDPIDEVVRFAGEMQRSLIVAGCPLRCSAVGYLRVQALIRESPHPVLIV